MKLKTSRLVKTRLMPPRKGKFVLPRPRLTARLRQAEDYRLTIVQGGTGYGKSTVLSVLADTHIPAVWYHLTGEDSDPLTFISHLLVGLDEILGGFSPIPIAQLEEWEQNRLPAAGTILVDSLVNEVAEKLDGPLFVILDDAHLLNGSNETCRLLNRFLAHAPSQLHMICATRYPLKLPDLVMWRMYEELLEIEQQELAFTRDEIAELFAERYELTLEAAELESLYTQIEGWPIALPLIWQNLQKRAKDVQTSLSDLAGSDSLFHYLTREVVNQQRPEIQQFLKQTAVLRMLDAGVCDQLRQADDSQTILDYLQSYGLFVVPLESGGLRYHHLFRDVLTNLNTPEEAARINAAAADIMLAHGDGEEAVAHLLDAEQYQRAAEVLTYLGRDLVNDGRLDTLFGWIGRLPEQMLTLYPILRVYLGHIARLHSQFDEALDHYRQAIAQLRQGDDSATLSYALYSQARVYLDTINPAEADVLLEEARSLIAEDEMEEGLHVQIFDLLAENYLNRGEFEAARTLNDVAAEKGHAATRNRELQARLLLRTGQLRDARQLLLNQLQAEKNQPVNRPRAHREPLLLLSLVHVFLGEPHAAEKASQQAMERGEQLNSHYITAVATSRLGLAYLIRRDSEGDELAKQAFDEAIDLSDRLMVPHLKLLALWGQCQMYGFKGDTAYARTIGNEAISIARKAGDRWIRAGVELFLGASHVLAGDSETALGWIQQAEETFKESGDRFGETCACLWRCLIWKQQNNQDRLEPDRYRLLDLVARNRYEFIFSQPSLYGPPEPRTLIPFLLEARQAGQGSADEKMVHASVVATKILEGLRLDKLETHPGYQLRVQMFGNFKVWRGNVEVKPGDWKRQKARQLFQLLVNQAGNLVEREQIIDMLWPELDEDGGQRDFKIAYTTLTKVLEPNRDRKAPSAYVTRDGTRYGLLNGADLRVDSFEFDRQIATGDRLYQTQPEVALTYYQEGLACYRGHYLQEYPYEEWAEDERRRFQKIWLRTAERVGRILMLQGDWLGVANIARQVLTHDNCSEAAWRMMIQAEYQLGNRAQAIRTYHECEEKLASELGLSPDDETFALYQRIS